MLISVSVTCSGRFFLFCFQWEAGGRRWTCNICNFGNDTPQHYICGLDDTGRRTDRHERPELSMGSIEFIAPGDYMIRPPQPPAYLVGFLSSGVPSG